MSRNSLLSVFRFSLLRLFGKNLYRNIPLAIHRISRHRCSLFVTFPDLWGRVAARDTIGHHFRSRYLSFNISPRPFFHLDRPCSLPREYLTNVADVEKHRSRGKPRERGSAALAYATARIVEES